MPEHVPERFAKIICTLGPSSDTYESILDLARAGMNVARLNFSHGTHADHRKKIGIIRRISKELERPIAILQDLQGPKIRVETFENGKIRLKKNSPFVLTSRNITGNENEVSVTYKNMYADVSPGHIILLDDGNLRLTVDKIVKKDIHCTVVYGGILRDHKGINLPGVALTIDALTKKDIADLAFGLENDVDYVALSFVQRPDDVVKIKKLISEKKKDTPVIAKIEKPQAVDLIENIIDLADGIMIARGDLGVEMEAEEVPSIQKNIISLCNTKGKPVITATQMLESMIGKPRPTRAEATDVANAVLDGTDAVMLSAETASGAFPVDSVKMMGKIIANIEKSGHDSDMRILLQRRKRGYTYETAHAIGYAVCHAAELVKATEIICLTQSGFSARMISRFRSGTSILAITPKTSAYFKTALIWGVNAIKVEEFPDNFDKAVDEILQLLRKKNIVKSGDKVVVTAGSPFDKKLQTNTLRIEPIE